MAPMNETVVVGSSGTIYPSTIYPGMSWGTIIAGWLVATAVAGLLYVAGLALGFAAFNPHDMAGAAKGIGVGTAIWLIVTWMAGLFVGGMFASWFDGKSDETMGSMHGIAVWALSITATAVWLSLGLGQAMHHRAPMDRGGHMAMGAAAAGDNDALLILQANVRRLTGHSQNDARPEMHGNADEAVVASILGNRTDTARALLMADGVSSETIDQTLPRLATEASAANARLRADADRAAHYTSMALWIAFLAGLLALLAAAIGGWMGAGNVHRVYHLRRYEGRPYRNL
ncbi:MAG TPA: hypothetical protein VIM06_09110 [Rhodanobacter sp.]